MHVSKLNAFFNSNNLRCVVFFIRVLFFLYVPLGLDAVQDREHNSCPLRRGVNMFPQKSHAVSFGMKVLL